MDWPPLVDAEGDAYGTVAIWGIVCPSCRVEIGDETVTLKVGRPWLKVVDDPDTT